MGIMLAVILAVATILGGITAAWFLYEKRTKILAAFTPSFMSRNLIIRVDDSGNLDQDKLALAKCVEKAKKRIRKNRPAKIKLINNKYQNEIGGLDKGGINKKVSQNISEKLDPAANALELLVTLRCNGYLDEFSESEFTDMIIGTLQRADLRPFNPFLERLEVWLSRNAAFRCTIEFDNAELKELFRSMGITHLFQITDGCVLNLPRKTVVKKVIPAIVYSLEKYAEQSLSWQTDDHFKIELWGYGIA